MVYRREGLASSWWKSVNRRKSVSKGRRGVVEGAKGRGMEEYFAFDQAVEKRARVDTVLDILGGDVYRVDSIEWVINRKLELRHFKCCDIRWDAPKFGFDLSIEDIKKILSAAGPDTKAEAEGEVEPLAKKQRAGEDAEEVIKPEDLAQAGREILVSDMPYRKERPGAEYSQAEKEFVNDFWSQQPDGRICTCAHAARRKGLPLTAADVTVIMTESQSLSD
eukprot:Hpha_TRINITY_DN16572_c1_g1::TRINITY_DN16572_c1_g1_i10::g.133196::m.133196